VVVGGQPNLGADEQTFCPECFRSLWQGGRCKRRDCPGYAPIYLRDQAERLRQNLAAWDGRTVLVTLTGPGADVLPWDRTLCPPGEHECSGTRGCRVDLVATAKWNAGVTKRLGDLLKAAREQTRRVHGGRARVAVLAYVCEAQRRGVFHPHVVLGYRTAADRAALDTFCAHLRSKRAAYGFGAGPAGFDAGLPDRFDGRGAGRYIAKYLRPDRAKQSFVPLLAEVAKWTPRNPATGRLKFLVRSAYVSPVLSRQTGVTMGFLRFRRWTHVVWGPGTSSGDAQFAYLLRGHLGAIPIRPGPLPSAEPIRPRAGPKNPRHDLALGEYRWYMAEQRREVEAAAANRRQPRAVQPSLWGECPASVV
jgi:hypothetical protein